MGRNIIKMKRPSSSLAVGTRYPRQLTTVSSVLEDLTASGLTGSKYREIYMQTYNISQ